ncbi:MAG: hypothetical protein PHW94_07500, partial [Sulfurimonas sp.]|nr:hypothetical protein [Sulfurimonas sp.]
ELRPKLNLKELKSITVPLFMEQRVTHVFLKDIVTLVALTINQLEEDGISHLHDTFRLYNSLVVFIDKIDELVEQSCNFKSEQNLLKFCHKLNEIFDELNLLAKSVLLNLMSVVKITSTDFGSALASLYRNYEYYLFVEHEYSIGQIDCELYELKMVVLNTYYSFETNTPLHIEKNIDLSTQEYRTAFIQSADDRLNTLKKQVETIKELFLKNHSLEEFLDTPVMSLKPRKLPHSLYLDDIRTPKTHFSKIVRSYEEAVSYTLENGVVEYISFDHDLGVDEQGEIAKSGYDFAKWLVESALDGELCFPENFTFNVHSANPVGKANIEHLLRNYISQH